MGRSSASTRCIRARRTPSATSSPPSRAKGLEPATRPAGSTVLGLDRRTEERPAELGRPSRWPWWIEFPRPVHHLPGVRVRREYIHPKATPSLRNGRWVEDLERWTWTLHEARPQPLRLRPQAAGANDEHVLRDSPFRHPAVGPHLALAAPSRPVPALVEHPGRLDPVLPPDLLGRAAGPAPADAARNVMPPSRTPHRSARLGPLDRGNFKDDNPYAAMPSLHMAWSTWCACAVIAAAVPKKRRRRWLAAVYPAVTLLVVVGTANHWILDAVGGWLLLAGGWWAATWWDRRRKRAWPSATSVIHAQGTLETASGGEDEWPARNPQYQRVLHPLRAGDVLHLRR